MSRAMAPSSTGRLRMKRRPSRAWCSARPLVRRRALLLAPQRQREHRHRGHGEARRGDEVRHRRVDVVEEAAARRPDDQAELPRPRVQGHQPRQPAVGDDQRRQRAERRRGERPRRPEQRGDGEDRHGRRRIGRRVQAEQHRREHLDGDGDGGDAAAVEAVGGRAGQRQQHQRREELDEPEQAERQLAVGDVVDLLAEGGGLQRRGDRRRRRREQERDDASGRAISSRPLGAGGDGREAGPPSGDGSAAWYTGRDELTRRRDPLDGRRRPGRAGGQGRGDADRAARGGDRAHRGDRPGAQRPRPSRGSTTPADWPPTRPARRPVPRRAVPAQGPLHGFAGQTLSNGNVALKAAGDRRHRRHDAGRPLPRRRAGDRRAHEQPGDGQPADDPAGGLGSDAQPVGPRAHARRVERRVPPRRSPPGWCRSPTPPTAAAASASRRRRAGWSGSSRARAGSPSARSAPRSASASSTA